MYARAYILHMFKGFIFTSIIGNAVSLYFLMILDDFCAISNYSWGSHSCTSISVTMQNMSKKKKTNCLVSSISLGICILNYLITRINEILNINL